MNDLLWYLESGPVKMCHMQSCLEVLSRLYYSQRAFATIHITRARLESNVYGNISCFSLNQSMGIISIGLILILYTHTSQARARQAESRLYDTRKSSLLYLSAEYPPKAPVAGRHTLGRFEFPQERGRSIIFASMWLPVAALAGNKSTQRPFFSLPYVHQRCRLAR